ncbi:tapasin isoform X3 [Chelonia mydas]|uniref:tapasin isoform X3 n=1 Tax=Chelonia mydas TaxID=8469 RepID=UPI0018A209D2|nr:tapasin isoform X3 [Chelonia mydas]
MTSLVPVGALALLLPDPAGALHRVPLPAGGRSKEGELPSCEINAYTPQEAHVPWAAGLTPERRSPLGLGGPWFISSVQAPARDYGVSAVLKSEEAAMSQQPAVIMATAVLSVFSRTPHLHSRLGRDVLLDCGFTAPPGPFSVEWRYQYRGAGRVVLAYDGVSGRAHVAEEGAQLFLEEGRAGADTNVSLRLSQVGVRHEGTYICTIYLPHLHAQQALELRITEPPMVTLHPDPLSVAPGAPAELACEVSGYYPLDVTVPRAPPWRTPLGCSWLRSCSMGSSASSETRSVHPELKRKARNQSETCPGKLRFWGLICDPQNKIVNLRTGTRVGGLTDNKGLTSSPVPLPCTCHAASQDHASILPHWFPIPSWPALPTAPTSPAAGVPLLEPPTPTCAPPTACLALGGWASGLFRLRLGGCWSALMYGGFSPRNKNVLL